MGKIRTFLDKVYKLSLKQLPHDKMRKKNLRSDVKEGMLSLEMDVM